MTSFLTLTQRSLVSLAGLVLCLLVLDRAQANPQVYQATVRSTVWIICPQGQGASTGSGALIDVQRRLVFTNCHVVGEQTQVVVFFPAYQGGRLVTDPSVYVEHKEQLAIAGQVVLRDPRRDLALIQLQRLPAGVRALPLATQAPSPGETLHSLGNSGVEFGQGGLGGTLWRYSKGEVRQNYRFRSGSVDASVVESQIPSNPGDSGGPVVNDRGQLVAITMGGHQRQGLVTYGIDVAELKALLQGNPEGVMPVQPRLAGTWAAPGTDAEGQPFWLALVFQANGTCVLVKGDANGEQERAEGRFSYRGGVLTLTSDGQSLRGTVTWMGNDRFVFTPPGTPGMTFQRQR